MGADCASDAIVDHLQGLGGRGSISVKSVERARLEPVPG
jgi:hypothetical protein